MTPDPRRQVAFFLSHCSLFCSVQVLVIPRATCPIVHFYGIESRLQRLLAAFKSSWDRTPAEMKWAVRLDLIGSPDCSRDCLSDCRSFSHYRRRRKVPNRAASLAGLLLSFITAAVEGGSLTEMSVPKRTKTLRTKNGSLGDTKGSLVNFGELYLLFQIRNAVPK